MSVKIPKNFTVSVCKLAGGLQGVGQSSRAAIFADSAGQNTYILSLPILCLHYDAKPYGCSTARHGTAKQTCVNSALSHRTVPYRTDLIEYARRRWSDAVRFGTVRQNIRV